MSLYLSHPASLEHDTADHPERPARLEAIEAALSAEGWLGWETVRSPEVDPEVLALVHPASHVATVRDAADRASRLGHAVMLDPDTVVSPGSFRAASHAAGGAVELVRRLVAVGDHRIGLSAHRPPGHHAPPDRAMGFCLFNSVAVAAAYAVSGLGLERVAIVDWDVHHGNGTQDVFWRRGDVLFGSVHQMPLYPGTGRAEEIGDGAGRGLTLNVPVPPGTEDASYGRAFDQLLDRVETFAPQLLLVSAGFDAHRDDPLANCRVSEAGFADMARAAREVAERLGIPLGLVLEGGYAVDALARSVLAVMRVLS